MYHTGRIREFWIENYLRCSGLTQDSRYLMSVGFKIEVGDLCLVALPAEGAPDKLCVVVVPLPGADPKRSGIRYRHCCRQTSNRSIWFSQTISRTRNGQGTAFRTRPGPAVTGPNRFVNLFHGNRDPLRLHRRFMRDVVVVAEDKLQRMFAGTER